VGLVHPAYSDSANEGFERIAGYGYATLQPLDHLWLTGGAAYDTVRYPEDFRNPPVRPGEQSASQLGPKAAALWNPIPQAAVRGAYTRSLGGVSLEQDYRLEPTQLAGFPQAYRSLVSESVAGSVVAPSYETLGLALDLKLGPRTFGGVEVQRLETGIDRTIGAFRVPLGVPPAVASLTHERIDYEERTLALSLNQLLGDGFVAGASYKLTQAKLHDVMPELPASFPLADKMECSRLHQIRGYLLFNHPSGFFAKAETLWYAQDNSGFVIPEPGDSFLQQNFFAGYRFARRRAELMLGILNVTGQDYRLEPLTIYQELPRTQVFEVRLNFVF
jgi:outer membrane receptor protein involved in Fe transport